MIRSFKDKKTEKFFAGVRVKEFSAVKRVAERKLLMLHAAVELRDLLSPPGNELEALKGDRKGQHSIRINDQFRICFVWKEDGPHEVEINKHYE